MKQRLLPTLSLCLLLTLFACRSGENKSVTAPPPEPPAPATPVAVNNQPPVADTLSDWIGAFYKLDDKSSQVQDTAIINSWWKQKIIQVELYGMPGNIFQQNGGGPYGSEWNPMTDLFLVVTSKQVWKNETVTLYLNGRPVPAVRFIKQIPSEKTGTIFYAQIPENIWSSSLRTPTRNDLAFKHGKAWADSAIKAGISLQASQVVKMDVRIFSPGASPLKLECLYEAAFGE